MLYETVNSSLTVICCCCCLLLVFRVRMFTMLGLNIKYFLKDVYYENKINLIQKGHNALLKIVGNSPAFKSNDSHDPSLEKVMQQVTMQELYIVFLVLMFLFPVWVSQRTHSSLDRAAANISRTVLLFANMSPQRLLFLSSTLCVQCKEYLQTSFL